MHDNRRFIIPAGCLREMTVAQFAALQKLTAHPLWENSQQDLHVSGTDYLGITMDESGFFIGIEKDGYAHS